MVLDDRTRTLYIFGGKVKDDVRYDMYAYDIATKTTRQLFSDLQRECGLESSFTQRAVIDPRLQEIYVYASECPLPALHLPFRRQVFRLVE